MTVYVGVKLYQAYNDPTAFLDNPLLDARFIKYAAQEAINSFIVPYTYISPVDFHVFTPIPTPPILPTSYTILPSFLPPQSFIVPDLPELLHSSATHPMIPGFELLLHDKLVEPKM